MKNRFLIFFFFCIGAAFASFYACIALRISENKPWIYERSCCDYCYHILKPIDLIPVFSYLFLRGKCRYCGAPIPKYTICSEILGGVAFATIYLRFGMTAHALMIMALSGILLSLSMVDIKTYTIPNGFILSGFFIFLTETIFDCVSRNCSLIQPVLRAGMAILLIAFFVLLNHLLTDLYHREMMGGGDIKFFALGALFIEPLQISFFLLLASLFGLLTCAFLKKKKIPFGPCISLALWVLLLL